MLTYLLANDSSGLKNAILVEQPITAKVCFWMREKATMATYFVKVNVLFVLYIIAFKHLRLAMRKSTTTP